ncbi:glucose PTS transporter subunit IIA [Paenibacillus sp. N1-5-1-14]|uniref:glucose PTS transporter subunit IIA n=1 Tax=Paenibacillus radicibacter TaxID=2972488 RepID=UPI002158B12A|nr:glucose PTS transporter subunit IIA [Paenibacillus radicibacter]MCR8641842.1 glucose PTS transporter subunit IIA [Paenibacillus radicibacter]
MNWMGNLQQLGRSLMLPTIALPLAAILLFLGNLPWDAVHAGPFADTLRLAGNTIFAYLPYIFAVGVALGLTESSAISGMSALLSYLLYTELIKGVNPGMQFGVLSGILVGIMAAIIYHRFKNVRLPEYLQSFGGPRIVPLVAGIAAIGLAYVSLLIEPIVTGGLTQIGNTLIGMGGIGSFMYGVLLRLLIPTGLHHILSNFFSFEVGTFTTASGAIVHGDLPRFFAGDPTAGIYMAGMFPIMMFALPAIALAIIREAREDLQGKVKVIFLTAALTSFLTGVTEPIEFAFLFVAPYLFFIHAFLSGTAMWLAYQLDIHHGFSFSPGAIDFLLNLHLSTNAWLLIPIGLGYGVLYYRLFRWAIRRFDIPTPGREEGSSLEEWAGDIPYRAPLIVQALGGKDNIKKIEACITRLRLTLANDRLMDTGALKHLGAAGVIRLGGGNVQVVFGTYSELIREEIAKVLRKEQSLVMFSAPMQGKMIELAEVPDRIFASKMVGNGVAFIPEKGELLAPVDGRIIQVYPSMHALGIETEEGLEVLLHIGIDTSNLPGEWFQALVKENDIVETGQLLIKFNLEQVKKHCPSLATPMVITNSDRVKSWSFAPYKAVKKGQRSVMSVVLKTKENTGGNTE